MHSRSSHRRLAILLLCLPALMICESSTVRADSLQSSTEAGSGLAMEDLTWHGTSNGYKRDGDGWEWKLDATVTRANDSVASQSTVDTTKALAVTAGRLTDEDEADLTYLFSRTPDAHLSAKGPALALGHTWVGHGSVPDVTVKGSFGSTRYTVEPPATTPLNLTEYDYGVDGKLAFNTTTLDANYTQYTYRGDPRQILLALGRSTRTIAQTLAVFRNAVYGFPTRTEGLGADWAFNSRWSIDVNGTRTSERAPAGMVYSAQAVLSRSQGAWTVGAGVERDLDIQFNQTLGLFDLTYSD